MEITDKLWTQNVDILYQRDRLKEIIPTDDMSLPEKLNALMRLSILVGFACVVLFSDYKYLYIPMLMAIIQIGAVHLDTTILKNTNESFENIDINNEQDIKELIKPEIVSSQVKQNQYCIKPSKNNPFMNAMVYDSKYRQSACPSYDNKEIKEDIENYFEDNLFKDVSDIYDNRASQRQFFTMPYTTFPNDSGSFAKWLYAQPETCKEGNGSQCVADNYERLQGNSYKMV
jgi:hypothetical protein